MARLSPETSNSVCRVAQPIQRNIPTSSAISTANPATNQSATPVAGTMGNTSFMSEPPPVDKAGRARKTDVGGSATPPADKDVTSHEPATLLAVALLFLRLGLTAFGGPAAHIAMMQQEIVD